MRILAILLIIAGGIALAYRSVTFFTNETVVDTGLFDIEVAKPHTIFLNPIIGAVMIGAGALVLLTSKKPIDA